MNTKTCPDCNEINPASSPFCAACGASLAAVQETQAPEITGRSARAVPGEREATVLDARLLDTFTVNQPKVFKKGPIWIVNLTPTHAVFLSQETGRQIIVMRDKAVTDIKFQASGSILTGMGEGTVASVGGVSLNFGANKSRLEKWLPPRPIANMQKDLRGWGIMMIIVGVVSLLIPEILDPIWGVVIIVLGILNLVIKHRAMFIVNGLTMILVGILNTISICMSLSTSNTFWVILGIMQIGWGVQEITKFGKYSRTQ